MQGESRSRDESQVKHDFQSRRKQRIYSKSSKCLLLAFLTVIFSTEFTIITLYIIGSNVDYQYVVIVDAGSSSSRTQIIRFRDWPFRTNAWVEELTYLDTAPGVSLYGESASSKARELGSTIKNLISQHVPRDKIQATSVYLGATAGMRLLSLQNPLLADNILMYLRDQIKIMGLKLRNKFSDIRIIRGESEGRYAWIALNYLMRKLGDEMGQNAAPMAEMIGALDLGGASTQIAFISGDNHSMPHTNEISLFGRSYDLYSYSFLCYGKDIANLRYLALLVTFNISNLLGTFESPCHLRNYTFDVETAALFTKPCITSEYAEILTGVSYHVPKNSPLKIKFVGTGSPQQCRETVSRLFNKQNCNQTSCSFNNIYQPLLRGSFKALSGFWYTIDAFKFPTGGRNLSRQGVADTVDRFCNTTWSEMSSNFEKSDMIYAAQYCFDGVYVDQLLDGYGFSTDKSWRNIEFVKSIAGATASWALGYAVEVTGHIESASPNIYLDKIAFIVGVLLLSLAFVGGISALLYVTHKGRWT